MEKIIRSSNPETFYFPLKPGATIPSDYKHASTVEEFREMPTRFVEGRRILSILFLGSFSKRFRKLADQLIRFIRAFFQLPVQILGEHEITYSKTEPEICVISDSFDLNKSYCKVQYSKKKKKFFPEINAGDILKHLRKLVPSQTFAVIAICAEQIYNPYQSADLIMGFACGNRACVISIPPCFDSRIKKRPKADLMALFEMAKTASHEISHTIGIGHCVEFSCMMNSQYVKESLSDPLYFCPDCLLMLHHAVGFDLKTRWEALLGFYSHNGFIGAAEWHKRRLSQYEVDCDFARTKS